MTTPRGASAGPVARKLAFLEENLAARARGGHPLSVIELTQVAAVIEALLPSIAAMEERPVPPVFRVLVGGRG